ncbi:MAG: Aromatic-ring-hydroxylating dioxygenase, beta subunit [Herminiimonas sp.]|nr:Aromatic-ring-hydroxylating dioxygenase, beta subunit [Herminiimonas sp.]
MNIREWERSSLTPETARALRMLVEEFNSEYCSVLDAGEIEKWPEFFTDDALYRLTARENVDAGLPVGLVYAEGKGMLIDRAVSISRTQTFAPRYNLHVCGNVRVLQQLENGDIIARTNFILLQTLVDGPTSLHLAGCYHDRFIRHGEGLLIKERQAIYDTTVIANDVVFPV